MPPSEHRFRAGDVVLERRSGERWVLAVDPEDDRVMAAGWPCSVVDVDRLALLEPATDERHIQMLREVASMSRPDPRRDAARRQLAALEGSPVPPAVLLVSRVDQALTRVDGGEENEVAQVLAEAYREGNRRHNDLRNRYAAEMQAIVAALGTPGAEMTVEDIVEALARLQRQEVACSTTIAALMRRVPASTAHIDSTEIDACDGEVLVVAQRGADGELVAIDVTWTPEEADRG